MHCRMQVQKQSECYHILFVFRFVIFLYLFIIHLEFCSSFHAFGVGGWQGLVFLSCHFCLRVLVVPPCLEFQVVFRFFASCSFHFTLYHVCLFRLLSPRFLSVPRVFEFTVVLVLIQITIIVSVVPVGSAFPLVSTSMSLYRQALCYFCTEDSFLIHCKKRWDCEVSDSHSCCLLSRR